jgi:predicted transcriptional regulator
MITTARDILSSKFVRIGEGHSTAEAVGIIFDPQSSSLREIVIIVLDGEGNYAGLVEPRDILESLGTELSAAGEDPAAQVTAIRRGLNVPVAEIARRDIPAARLDDNLATLLSLVARTESATIPVFDNQVFVGIVPVTALFDALCKKTLAADGDDLPFMGGNPAA